MASVLNPLQIRYQLGRNTWAAPTPFGPAGWRYQNKRENGSILVSVAEHPGGYGEWIHASIAFEGRMPTYDDLVVLHEAVFGDGYAFQVFAPPSQHVNIHEHALHLFGRSDGRPPAGMPEFGRFGSI